MSVIAWDGSTLACDQLGTRDSICYKSTKMRVHNGVAVAWAGIHQYGLILADWFFNGADPEKWPKFQSGDDWVKLIVVKDGVAYEYEQEPFMVRVESGYRAWGSGGEIAIGAMGYGASADEAVRVATENCPTCGLGVDVFISEPTAPAKEDEQ